MYRDITFYPDKAWATFFSTFVAAAFVAAPLLYAAINIMISPKVDSGMWDEFSKIPDANVVVVAPRSPE
jgi:hypothetical protein